VTAVGRYLDATLEAFCAMLPSDGGEGASEIGCPQGN